MLRDGMRGGDGQGANEEEEGGAAEQLVRLKSEDQMMGRGVTASGIMQDKKKKGGDRNMTELWKIQSQGIKFEPGESICSLPTEAETDANPAR